MLYTVTLKLEAYHVPTEAWHVHEAQHGLRAVSRKHALDKGLRVVTSWPGYRDREGHPEWRVGASVTLPKEVQ
jgi:hypothetical protein